MLPRVVSGLLDFGDMHEGLLVAEPAIAAAYALLGEEDPLAAMAAVLSGYHAALPLTEEEIALFPALVGARLAVSVIVSARRARADRSDPYASVSEAPAWAALERLDGIHPRFAHAVLREACSLPPLAQGPKLAAWLGRVDAASVLDLDLRRAPHYVVDLSVGSSFLGADPAAMQTEALSPRIFGAMAEAGAAFGLGRYGETRGVYVSPLFASGGRATDERRTVHLGVDLFVAPGSAVRAPLAGVVHALANNRAPQDYGPLVILRHAADDGTPFYSLYGHLSRGRARRAPRGAGGREGRGDRPGRRPARQRRLAAAPALPADPGPLRARRGLPRRRAAEPAPALRGALARPEPAAADPAGRFRGGAGASTRRSRRADACWGRACACPTGGRSRSCAASGSTSTTTRGARTSTPTTTCRSSATATRRSCARRSSSWRCSTPTRATCTTSCWATRGG